MLKVLMNYRNGARGLVYKAGRTVNADEAIEAYLLRDAPECFERPKKTRNRKAKTAPEINKAIMEADESKVFDSDEDKLPVWVIDEPEIED